jgi:hypothetical protein
MFKVFFLVLITLNLTQAAKKCKDVLLSEANKGTFQNLLARYKNAYDVAPDFFKSKEQVWYGECVSIFEWDRQPDYYRHEHYLVVFRPKTMPGEPTKAQYGAINYGGDPYNSGIQIKSTELAIGWLKGDASENISIAKNSKKHGSLRATNYKKKTNLRRDIWNGSPTLFYTVENKNGKVEEVCYFNDILVK